MPALPSAQRPAPPSRSRLRRRAATFACLAVVALSGCTGSDAEGGGARPSAEDRAVLEVPEETLVGWSAAEVPGLEQEVLGTWMARDSWEDLRLGHWLADNPDYVAFVEAHPERAADVGVPLVPHDSETPVDEMLASAAAGEHDEDYRAMGAALARTGPRPSTPGCGGR